ncbi:MAG: hypothetical protein OEV00_03080 [Acidobacteriota bacterium]|nr:hypothetical protein [Acidobacteriota bacterium]MDH3784292.1 hypothetical protein [Acidobacteriota bacterium]
MDNWWGDYEVAEDQTLRWQLGPKTLWITRGDSEWRVAGTEGPDRLASRLIIAEPAEEPAGDDDNIDVRRFASRSGNRSLRLEPALPDLPVVVRTNKPFVVPAMEETTLFLSAPLWLRVYLDGREVEQVDAPIARPSDTWFGPDTMTGELCYALRTSARLHLENLPRRPHRAISAVRIQNNAPSALPIEKLKVPVPHLSLFVSDEGHLWTEALTLEREDDSGGTKVRLDDRPRQIVATERIARPRKEMSRGFLLDAFGKLFVKKGRNYNE